jgi:uncharacterized membrane protein
MQRPSPDKDRSMSVFFTDSEILALAVFLIAWTGYTYLIEHGPFARHSLNARMDKYRREWMLRMVERDVRILDSTILGSLQNGSAFFASASLIALGGVVSLFKSADEAQMLLSALPFAMESSHAMWDIKVLGLIVIFAYGFFKFAWAYRILNYAAILIGATPNIYDATQPHARAMAERAAGMITLGGAHFNRGQRAFFFALGYLGWFVSPYVFMITTAAIVVTMARRQYGAESLRPLKGSADD